MTIVGSRLAVSIALLQNMPVTTLSTAKYVKVMYMQNNHSKINEISLRGSTHSIHETPPEIDWNNVVIEVPSVPQNLRSSGCIVCSREISSDALCVKMLEKTNMIMQRRIAAQRRDFKVAAIEDTNERMGATKRMIMGNRRVRTTRTM